MQAVFQIREKYDGKIDFFLADITLPSINGIELSEIFAAKNPDTKIILISAYPALASRGQKEGDGILENRLILAKPYAYGNLEEILLKSLSLEPGDIRLDVQSWIKNKEAS